MKLAFIISGFYNGGFISSLGNLIANLDKSITKDIYVFNRSIGNEELVFDNVNVIMLKHNDNYVNKLRLKIKLAINKTYMSLRKSNPDSIVLRQIYYENYVKTCMPKIDLSSYDCVISWEEVQCNYFLAYNVIAKRKIGYVHPDYLKVGYSKEIDSNMLNCIDEFCCVTKENYNNLIKIFSQDKIKFIPNSLNVNKIQELSNGSVDYLLDGETKIITVCRLDNKSKALDRMCRIIKRLNEDHQFKWYLVGDGPDRDLVIDLKEKYNLSNLILLGQKNNPFIYIKQADLFVLQSYYEGKPISVDEALILNVPVLVTNYVSAKEQVRSDYGFIVENDEDSIYNKLDMILNQKELLLAKKDNLSKQDYHKYQDISLFMDIVKGK